MTTTAPDAIAELAERLIATGEVRGAPADDPVNVPMIRHWMAAMGDTNPVYLENGVAPPAMVQVWTMPGLNKAAKSVRTTVDDLMTSLTAAGYTGVVATNCEHTYHRHLRVGERPIAATRLGSIAGPKATAMGEGFFVTWHVTWYADHDEAVAEMLFRVLKFHPPREVGPEARTEDTAPPATPPTGRFAQSSPARAPRALRPAINRDTRFFWDGVEAGELRIQSCSDCEALRHPPGPLCVACHSANRSYVVARGVGEVYSYVVHHNPPVPGRSTPFVVAVIELPEGVRMVGNIVDCAYSDVIVGMPVGVTYQEMDDDTVLPMWRPL